MSRITISRDFGGFFGFRVLLKLAKTQRLWRENASGHPKEWGFWVGIDKTDRLPSPSRLLRGHETLGPEPPRELLDNFLRESGADGSPLASHEITNGRLGSGFCSGFCSGSGIGGGSEKPTPPPTAILSCDSQQSQETPRDLHPINYATKVLEELGLPQTLSNLHKVAAAVKAVISEGKSGAAACDFLISKAKDAQNDGVELNKFWFEDAKWRPNGKRNGKPSVGQIVEREQAILRSRSAAQ